MTKKLVYVKVGLKTKIIHQLKLEEKMKDEKVDEKKKKNPGDIVASFNIKITRELRNILYLISGAALLTFILGFVLSPPTKWLIKKSQKMRDMDSIFRNAKHLQLTERQMDDYLRGQVGYLPLSVPIDTLSFLIEKRENELKEIYRTKDKWWTYSDPDEYIRYLLRKPNFLELNLSENEKQKRYQIYKMKGDSIIHCIEIPF